MPNEGDKPTFEVPQRILVLRDFCIRARGAACNHCEEACPAGAISFTDEGFPVISHETCTTCCMCLGTCDAFTSPKVTATEMRARIRRVALSGQNPIITCDEALAEATSSPAENVVALPCVAALSVDLWTLLLAEGPIPTIAVDFALCESCDRAGSLGMERYSEAIAEAERRTGKTVGFADSVPERIDYLSQLASPEGMERRGAFAGAAHQLADIASGRYRKRTSSKTQRFLEQREREDARARLDLDDGTHFNRFTRMGRLKKTMYPSRRMLLEAITEDPAIAERTLMTLSHTDLDLCRGSLSCATACPTGARTPDPEDGSLAFDARFCIGCGLCVAVCSQHAVTMEAVTAEALQC